MECIKLYELLKNCECHWTSDKHDDIFVCLEPVELIRFFEITSKTPGLFDDTGIDVIMRSNYIVIPSFNYILDYFDIDSEQFYQDITD